MPLGPKIIVIAGPNGAGKTTFAREFLPNEADCPMFVNADLIAAGLAPFAPETAAVQAGRVMLQELARHFANRASFAFETTLSGRAYLHRMRAWRNACARAAITFRKTQSGGVFSPDGIISGAFTRRRLTLGHCTTMPAHSRCCWIGAKNHEQTAA